MWPQWISALIGGLGMLLGIAMGYGALRTRVIDMKDDIAEIKARLSTIDGDNKQTLRELGQLHADVGVVAALVNTMEARESKR